MKKIIVLLSIVCGFVALSQASDVPYEQSPDKQRVSAFLKRSAERREERQKAQEAQAKEEERQNKDEEKQTAQAFAESNFEVYNKSGNQIFVRITQNKKAVGLMGKITKAVKKVARNLGEVVETGGISYRRILPQGFFATHIEPALATEVEIREVDVKNDGKTFKFPARNKLYLTYDDRGMLRAQSGPFKGLFGLTESGKSTKENIKVNLELWNDTKDSIFVRVKNEQSNLDDRYTELLPGRDKTLRDTIDPTKETKILVRAVQTWGLMNNVGNADITYTIKRGGQKMTFFLVWELHKSSDGKRKVVGFVPQKNIIGGAFGLSRSGYSLGNNVNKRDIQEERAENNAFDTQK